MGKKKASIIVLILVLLTIGMLSLALNIQPAKSEWTGTVYIRADGSVDPPDAPVIIYDNVTYVLTGNITSSADGIVVERDNIVIDGAGYTLQGTGSGKGIDLTGRSNVIIKNMEIKAFNWEGILLYYSSNNKISGNNITNNGYGIKVYYSSNNIITGNNITANNEHGIGLGFALNNKIYRNNITANNWAGIYFYDSSNNNTIIGNNITNNVGDGIYMDRAAYNMVVRNNIEENYDRGICLLSSSSNIIYHNNLINNTSQVYIENSLNVWDDGYPSGGNYWSNYTRVDANGDGIGDTPYVIDADNQDRYPLMYPWSSLPVHNINTGLGYATIQEAINAAETVNGHTIFVETGTYYEHVVVNKSISLLGESKNITIIDGGGNRTVVRIIANDTIVSGFTIQKSGMMELDCGIEILANYGGIVKNVTVTNNIVRDNNLGIFLRHSMTNTIKANEIYNNNVSIGIDESANNYIVLNIISNSSGGIWLGSGGNIVSNNTVTLNRRYGIQLDGSSFNTINGNNIANDEVGIRLSYSSNNTISGNNITANNWHGIFLEHSSNNIIRENNITANNKYGVELWYSSNNSIAGNNITANNRDGIWLQISSNNNIIVGNNIIANNWSGIMLDESSNNIIYHNNLIDNGVQASLYESYNNLWDDGYPSGGNYWSDYAGIDLHWGSDQNETGSDGIGDTQYIVDENNVDRYPLMGPFNSFNASVGYSVDVISNSTVKDFRYFESNSTIIMHVSNMTANQAFGFCRLTIPHEVMHPPYTVKVNDTTINFQTIYENYTEGISIIYFAYEHSKLEITIIPEYPSMTIMLLLSATLLTTALTKRKLQRRKCIKEPQTSPYF